MLCPLALLALCAQRICKVCIRRRAQLDRFSSGCACEMEIDVLPAPSHLQRFSTEMLPERERFSAFQEFARRIMLTDVIDHSGGRPRIDLTFMALGPVSAAILVSTPAEFTRHANQVKDGNDDLMLTIVETGAVQYAHAGKEVTCNPRSGYFSDNGRPRRGFGPCGGSVRNIITRAAALKPLVPHSEDLAGRAVHPSPALRLLHSYLRSLLSVEEPLSAELASTIGVHLLDLVAAALGPTDEAAEIVAERGVKAARVRAVLSEIARHFSDPNFDLDSVAGSLRLSRRYVQQLLETTGKSFTEHLMERRLERTFAMLTNRRCLHFPIIDIAFAAGFSDVSHFNRMFRRRFGETPSGVRATATVPERR
jgi:AraC-like DNA-binding protein